MSVQRANCGAKIRFFSRFLTGTTFLHQKREWEMEGAMREMQGGILDGYKISPRCLLIGEMYGWGVGDFFFVDG